MDRLATMETFIRVVDTHSFSSAARHLSVSQPAVSKAIAQLEDRLSTRLLLRSPRGLRPTEAGYRFYERARRAVEEAEGADLAARGHGVGLTGKLRVSIDTTVGLLHIIPRLPVFLTAHPDLSIDLILEDRAINLIEEGVDIALRTGELRDSSLIARKVAASRRVVVGSPAYFERAGIPKGPMELRDHATVIYTRDGGPTWRFRHCTSEVSVSASGRLRVTSAEGMRAAVLGGMGLAITAEWVFARELAAGAVQTVLAEWTLPDVDLWVVLPTGRQVCAKARTFAAFVEAELRDGDPSGARGTPGVPASNKNGGRCNGSRVVLPSVARSRQQAIGGMGQSMDASAT